MHAPLPNGPAPAALPFAAADAGALGGAGPPPAPADRVLAGLVAHGHGREACGAFLGLDDAAVMNRVVALGLATPGDRPLRLGGCPRAWLLPDIRRLVDLWCRNLPGTRIAGLLGRGASAVYRKARWLGLFRRPRSALLRDPPPFPGIDGPTPAPAPRLDAPSPPPPGRDKQKPWGAGETGRLRDLGRQGYSNAEIGGLLGRPQGAVAGKFRRLGVRRPRGVVWTAALLDQVAARYFALQRHAGIARDLGIPHPAGSRGGGAVKDIVHRLQLPARPGLPLIDHHDPALAERFAWAFKGWRRKICPLTRRPFWTDRPAAEAFSRAGKRLDAYRSATCC